MIQPLRTYHRRMFLVLAVVVPSVFVAGLISRRKPPATSHRTSLISILITGQDRNWKNHLIQVVLDREQNEVRLLPIKTIVAADVLIYYADQASANNSLSPSAKLLGHFSSNTFASFPSSSLPASGFLVLYSPAQKSVLDFGEYGGKP